jgi:hypothetical protein
MVKIIDCDLGMSEYWKQKQEEINISTHRSTSITGKILAYLGKGKNRVRD